MPAYVWITSLSAVAFVGLVAFGRGWFRSVWYSWAHAAHVLDLTMTEEIPGAEYVGSMILDEEHPLEPLPAPVVDAEPWRQQIADELAPEALDWEQREEEIRPAYGGWVSGPSLDPGPGDAAVEPPASPGPAECSPWLAEQLAVLRAWSEWQQQKMALAWR